jgi:hypothetical protein
MFSERFLSPLNDQTREFCTQLQYDQVYEFVRQQYAKTIRFTKGKISERETLDMLKSKLTDFEISDVSFESSCGDIMVTRSYESREIKILIDVKNYSSAVPHSEVEKFYRDVEVTGVDAGILLSLNSKIVGFNDPLMFSSHGPAKICVVAQPYEDMIIYIVKYMYGLCVGDKTVKRSKKLEMHLNNVRSLIEQFNAVRQDVTEIEDVITTRLRRLNQRVFSIQYDISKQLDMAFNSFSSRTAYDAAKLGIKQITEQIIKPYQITVDDKKILINDECYIKIGRIDKIIFQNVKMIRIPPSEFQYKSQCLTIDIDEHNYDTIMHYLHVHCVSETDPV